MRAHEELIAAETLAVAVVTDDAGDGHARRSPCAAAGLIAPNSVPLAARCRR